MGAGVDTAGFSGFVYYLPAQDVTISGVIDVMDPFSVQPRIIYPALETLVPGFSS